MNLKPLLISIGSVVGLAGLLLLIFPQSSSEDIVVHVEVPAVEMVLPQTAKYYGTPSIMSSQDDVQSFYASTSVGMITEYNPTERTKLSVEVGAENAYLYEIAEKYFICYYGLNRVSPILPMAISNVETPGRADNSVTWCALMPTRYVDVGQAMTFNVTNVYDTPETYKALTTEYSTRDRGCLQMSPTYGTGNSYFNGLMSGTEKSKLVGKTDTWSQGASDSPGDRFYLPDVLLRMSAAMQGQLDMMVANGYIPETDAELICMLACGHHNSGVWYNKNHNKSIGAWVSSEKAKEWCNRLGSEEFVSVLTQYARTHDNTYIDSNVARSIWKSYAEVPTGYTGNDVVLYYPIKALYAYIKLSLLYAQ